jgi:protease-4
MNDELAKTLNAAEISNLRWNRTKRFFIALMVLWSLGFYFYVFAKNWGLLESDSGVTVPVVRIEGGIGVGSESGNADAVISSLKKAFSEEKAKAVIVYIDSPGGSPTEADRITAYIDSKRKETNKEVIAICGTACASAGYMIALHSGEIYASKYSLVGSIGAVMSSWNFADVIKKTGVQHQAFVSGKNKAMLNPFIPTTEDHIQKANSMVGSIGDMFAEDVKLHRRGKLTENQDLFTGEVWVGEEAKRLGLIDGVSTLDQVVIDKFGKDAKVIHLNKSSDHFPYVKVAVESAVRYFIDSIQTTSVIQ